MFGYVNVIPELSIKRCVCERNDCEHVSKTLKLTVIYSLPTRQFKQVELVILVLLTHPDSHIISAVKIN